MNTRSIEYSVETNCDPARSFEALVTPSDIRHWWQASRVIVIAQSGGYWMGTWGEDEDQPDYICGYPILEYDPPRKLTLGNPLYVAKGGDMPFEAEFRVDFHVESSGEGTRVTVVQDGFPAGPEADEFYAGCQKGWKDSLGQLAEYLNGLSR